MRYWESQVSACFKGWADSRQWRTRPFFLCLTRPARSRTCRCFITAGSDILCGAASADTAIWPRVSAARIARRVGSARARKVASKLRPYLTIGFTITPEKLLCQEWICQNLVTYGSSNASSHQVESVLTWEWQSQTISNAAFTFRPGPGPRLQPYDRHRRSSCRIQ